jgi:hypothetical protein
MQPVCSSRKTPKPEPVGPGLGNERTLLATITSHCVFARCVRIPAFFLKFLRATHRNFGYAPAMVKAKPSRTLATLRDTVLPKLLREELRPRQN